MQDFGLVSVVMPAYNSEAFIAEAIQSVLHQIYPNWELLVVDDASSDDTLQIIQKFCGENKSVKLLQNPVNLGTQHARNKAIEAASGDFIAFLDADDRWKPEKLSKQLNFMFEEKLTAAFSSYELIDEKGRLGPGISKEDFLFHGLHESGLCFCHRAYTCSLEMGLRGSCYAKIPAIVHWG